MFDGGGAGPEFGPSTPFVPDVADAAWFLANSILLRHLGISGLGTTLANIFDLGNNSLSRFAIYAWAVGEFSKKAAFGTRPTSADILKFLM